MTLAERYRRLNFPIQSINMSELHSDKNAYDKLIKNIIKQLGNLTKLFKKTAWKTFGGKSSNQNTHGRENQLSLFATPPENKQCYNVSDITDYIFDNFKE